MHDLDECYQVVSFSQLPTKEEKSNKSSAPYKRRLTKDPSYTSYEMRLGFLQEKAGTRTRDPWERGNSNEDIPRHAMGLGDSIKQICVL